jgi:hypothetical protein
VDLAFANRENLIDEITVLPSLGKSDHVTLLITMSTSIKSEQSAERLNYHKTDLDRLRAELQAHDWEQELSNLTVEATWEKNQG